MPTSAGMTRKRWIVSWLRAFGGQIGSLRSAKVFMLPATDLRAILHVSPVASTAF
jgi:hypothetical protein